MKIEARRVAGVLARPAEYRALVLHGEDADLVGARAREVTIRVAGALDDPFRVSVLDREAWERLPEEASARSLTGGARVVRVRDAAELLLGPLTRALAAPGEALIVIEAAGLARGKLRTLAEASPAVALIACYPPNEAARRATIREGLNAASVVAEPALVEWLVAVLPAEQGAIESEIEKLVLLAGPTRQLTQELCAEASGGTGADGGDVILAALRTRADDADRAVEHALADGMGGVGVIRIAILSLLRLHRARHAVAEGATMSEALSSMRPPVFFRDVPLVSEVLSRWSGPGLARVMEAARRAEAQCKQTGANPDLLARNLVGWVARLTPR